MVLFLLIKIPQRKNQEVVEDQNLEVVEVGEDQSLEVEEVVEEDQSLEVVVAAAVEQNLVVVVVVVGGAQSQVMEVAQEEVVE